MLECEPLVATSGTHFVISDNQMLILFDFGVYERNLVLSNGQALVHVTRDPSICWQVVNTLVAQTDYRFNLFLD